MSKLLIAEPPLQVLPTLAKALGLAPAIVLQQLHYHSLKSRDDGWVQKSITDWHSEDFPFMSLRSVERAFGILRERGVIATAVVPSAGGRESKVRVDHDALEKLAGGSRQNGGTPSRQVGGTGTADVAGPRTNKGTTERKDLRTPPAPQGEQRVFPSSRSPVGRRPQRPGGQRKRALDNYLREIEVWSPHPDELHETLAHGWELIRMQLRDELGTQDFQTWIAALHPHSDDGRLLVLAGPDAIVGWAQDRFREVIASLTNRNVEIVPCRHTSELRAAA